MELFIGPKFNLPLAWLSDAAYPLLLKTRNIQSIEISQTDKKMLRSLKEQRLLFFSNHPSAAEPVIAWHIANLIGSRFHYMATRRAFNFYLGLVGELFRSVNVFSIIPGIPDKKSMKMARSVLARPAGKLVLYPEGEPVCGENDDLMPMMPGIVKLGLGGLEDARKQEPGADIMVLPGFIKYVIQSPRDVIEKDLHRSVSRVERALGLRPGNRNMLRRFLQVGRVILEQLEQEYNIQAGPEQDFEYRTGHVRHVMLDNVATKLGVPKYDQSADAIQKLRHLTSILELIELKYPNPQLPQISKSEWDWADRECVRAYDFITIKREYLVSYPTPERFYEWLARFESLVLGAKPRALGGEGFHLPVKAVVSFAKPFALGDFQAEYNRDKTNGLHQVLDRLQSELSTLRDTAVQLTQPIVEPYDIGET
ncbi:MAG: 1-acyl-sn-glycerol-3-phosphate acyltransferase [Leptospiraceae bacterium]|nr:1-acyl-sn-glycerol-3-phosphate acyltransferase [Leptospiraceae bacterium]